MTDCAFDDCDRASVGTIEWESGRELGYCQKHIRGAKIDQPELIAEVQLL